MSGGGGGGGIRGYLYYLGLHMGICRGPVNSIVEIRVGDKTALGIEIGGSGIFPLFAPELFGGIEAEGGVGGALRIMMGEPDQVPPIELVLMNNYIQPGFRRICSIFFDGMIGAMNPYPKPWSFRIRRSTKGWDGEPWYPEKAMIQLARPMAPKEITSSPWIHSMNPAHIFYEIMTNREWGRGLPRSALDDINLRSVADQLYAEGFGLCYYWARSDSIESLVQSVLDHIGGVMRPNPRTGELQLKLLRFDYTVADLPLFDNESGLLDITEAAVAAMPTIINHCMVKFVDPITGKEGSVGTHNLAGVQGSQGEINTQIKDYPGLPTPDLASRVALRDLRASSNALRKFTLTLDRRGQDVQPGDVVRVRDYTRGIPEMVVRIGKFEDGPHVDGRISVTAIQDVFTMTPTSFTGNQPPTWEGPNTSPCIGYNRTFEMPYFMLARNLSAADLAFVPETAGYIGQVVEMGDRRLNAGYRLAVRNGLPTPDDIPDSDVNYCPTVPAHWDGGDCVKIVGGTLLWTVTVGAAPFVDPSSPQPFGYQGETIGSIAPFGSISGLESSKAQLLWLIGPYGTEPGGLGFNMYGDASEGWSQVVLTYGEATYEIPLAYDDVGGVWYNAEDTLPFMPTIGSTIGVEVKNIAGGRVVQACCVCLEIRMTGSPTPVAGAGAPFLSQCNGTITTPSSLVNMNPGYPSWGSPHIDFTTDPDTVSDVSLVFAFGPEGSPFLTSMMTCKVYDDDDGGALVYSTTLYKMDGMEGMGGFSYFERPTNFDDLNAAYPAIHGSGSYPVNPATALNGHALRFVLGTANLCCGGIPPVSRPLRLTGVSISDILGPQKVDSTVHERPAGEGLQLWYNVPADADIKTTNPLDQYWNSNQSIYVLLEVEATGGGYEPIEARYPDFDVTVENVFGCVLSGISPTGGAMPQGPVAVIATGSSEGVGQAKVTISDGHGETLRTFYVNSTDSSFTMPVLRSIPSGTAFTNDFNPQYTASTVTPTGLRAINCDWQFEIGDPDQYYPGLPANTRLSGVISGANEIVAPSGFKIVQAGVPYNVVSIADMSVSIACGVISAAGTPNTIVNVGVAATEMFPTTPANGTAGLRLIADADFADKFAPWGTTVEGVGSWAITELFTCSKGSIVPPGDIPG